MQQKHQGHCSRWRNSAVCLFFCVLEVLACLKWATLTVSSLCVEPSQQAACCSLIFTKLQWQLSKPFISWQFLKANGFRHRNLNILTAKCCKMLHLLRFLYKKEKSCSSSSSLCPFLTQPHSLSLSLPSASLVSRLNIQDKEQYCLFSQISPRPDHCLHYRPLSLFCSSDTFPVPPASQRQSVGCDTVGRCGQEFSLMPVKDKLVSVRWDARHTHACKASSVWGLEFVCFLLCFHSRCLSVSPRSQAAGCYQGLCMRMNDIIGFFFVYCKFIHWMF